MAKGVECVDGALGDVVCVINGCGLEELRAGFEGGSVCEDGESHEEGGRTPLLFSNLCLLRRDFLGTWTWPLVHK